MNFDQADADVLLASLQAPFPGLFLAFSQFLEAFREFIVLDYYCPSYTKKYTRRKKKQKKLPTEENAGHLAGKFFNFLVNALQIFTELLTRSPRGAEGEEGMQDEKITELCGIYRLIVHCFRCVAPCISGKPYTFHIVWGALVIHLEMWNKYCEAEEEGFALLESLHTLLVAPPSPLNSTVLFLPDPSHVGSAGADPHFRRLVCEVVMVLIKCSFKSQSRDASVFKRILVLTEQTHPWICIMETNDIRRHHKILIQTLYNCALYVVEERKSFDDEFVYSFCIKILKDCTDSPLLDRFPFMAHKIYSVIGPEWDKRYSFMVDVLRISSEINFYWKKVDLAKYVDALLDLISKFIEGFYLSESVACKDGSELSLKVADNVQPSKALEMCCKTISKHIELLCQSTYSKSNQSSVASKDSIIGVINDAITKCAIIIDILHKLGASNYRAVVIKSICELSVVEISFPNSSICFSLVKQWIKMLCEDISDANEMVAAPFLYICCVAIVQKCQRTFWERFLNRNF